MRALRLHRQDTGSLFLLSPLHTVAAYPHYLGGCAVWTSHPSEYAAADEEARCVLVREYLDQVGAEWDAALTEPGPRVIDVAEVDCVECETTGHNCRAHGGGTMADRIAWARTHQEVRPNAGTPIAPALDIPATTWRADGVEDLPGGKRAYLTATVTVCGVNFHAQAVEVYTAENGTQCAVQDVFNIDCLYDYAGAPGPLATVEIDGRRYVVALTPHSS